MHGTYGTVGPPVLDAFNDRNVADIARMPDLVAGFEMGLQPGIEPAVGVAEEADALHAAK
jgi:hypothetical protein